jgi:pimeloyl-ACP methyl ester carboxylesterase
VAKIAYRRTTVEGLEIFYREAGDQNAPAILLLHGFPTASHMFRELMPRLAGRFRLIAPDLPGFGQSAMPTDGRLEYTFESLAQVVGAFIEHIKLERFAMYVFDYGAPIGLRMALRHPERITAIISQNGNAYEEGLSEGWDSMKEYWEHPTADYRESLHAAFTLEATRYQYAQGVDDPSMVSPDGSTLDDFYLARPGAHEVQISLFTDYGTNVALYPKIQEYLRSHQPPLLAVWGKNDPYFLPAGAEAFRRDLPKAEILLLPTGHFALETHCEEIALAIGSFLDRELRSNSSVETSATEGRA